MRNKGIKSDRNAQSWGTCISCTAGIPAANSESWQPGLKMKQSEGARELFPQAPKALIPADPWGHLYVKAKWMETGPFHFSSH